MPSAEIKEYFPYLNVRNGQKELIEDIERTCLEGKTLLACAPTGLGKTASALSVTLKHAIKNKQKVFFLTNRHTQHQIAIETLNQIKDKIKIQFSCADLIGKRWMCHQKNAALVGSDFNEFCKSLVEKGQCEYYTRARNNKGLEVEAKSFVKEISKNKIYHNQEIISLSEDKGMCSYEISLALAKDSTVIIGDYYYLFNPSIRATILNKLDCELKDIFLVIDEAHNLPSRVVDMLSVSLTCNMLKNGIKESHKFGFMGIALWLEKLNDLLEKLKQQSKENEQKIDRIKFINQVNAINHYDDLINEFEAAAEEVKKKQNRSYLGGISYFLEEWKKEDKGFTSILSKKEGKFGTNIVLERLCLDPSLVTREIFREVKCSILMSGTLHPTSMYRDLLGIENPIEKRYESPFDQNKKLSIIVPETSTKYTSRGEGMYKMIAQKCMEITSLIPGNTALFFPSYYLRDEVCRFLTSEKKLFWEKSEMTKEEKDILLNDFKMERIKGGILLAVTGASFAEGIDLPGDLLKGVVVVGLPLAKPDLKSNELINYYNQKVGKGMEYGYIYPAINKCLQSAGRCIRHEDDKGVVVYLDERFAWDNYYNYFPDRVGLIVTRKYLDLITKFFQN